MFKIQIDTKSNKSYSFNCPILEAFTTALSKNEILWLDSGNKGIYIPPHEVAQILFEKVQEEGSPLDLASRSPEPHNVVETDYVSSDYIEV